MAGEIEARLKALDLVLPEAAAAIGRYVSYLHLDGQLSFPGNCRSRTASVAVTGTLGADLDLDQGQEAARLCASIFSPRPKPRCGDLDRIVQLLRLNGFVNAVPGFADHPKVHQRRLRADRQSPRQQGAPYPHRGRLLEPAAQRRRRDRCDFCDRLGPSGL